MDKNQNSFDEPARIITRADAPEEEEIPGSFKESVSMFFKRHFSKKAWKQFCRNTFPHKGDSGKEIFRKLVMDISFVLLILALSYIVFYYFSYRGRIDTTTDLIDQKIDVDELSIPEQKKYWNTIKAKYPDVDFPSDMLLTYAPHYALNQDTGGWLSIPNTNIDTVLMQSDSRDYYLYRNIYKEYSRYGNPYIDYRCKIGKDGLSKNTIIYGHNTHDGLMFHQLTNYMTLEGYKNAPTVIFDTLYERTYWKIFAVMLTNATPDGDNGHMFRFLFPDFPSESSFMNVIDGINARSMIKTGVDVKASDNILTLYTCYQNIFPNGRLVVFARQVRDGESKDVDTSNAYFNYNARFPQAYYDKRGLVNPYA